MYTHVLEAWPRLKLNHFDILFDSMEDVDIKKYIFLVFNVPFVLTFYNSCFV
jgi:hypothetical protein